MIDKLRNFFIESANIMFDDSKNDIRSLPKTVRLQILIVLSFVWSTVFSLYVFSLTSFIWGWAGVVMAHVGLIFADSIKKFLNLSIINLFYPFLLFYKHNSKFSHFKTKFCHSSSINSNSFVLFKYPVIKSNLDLFAFNWN